MDDKGDFPCGANVNGRLTLEQTGTAYIKVQLWLSKVQQHQKRVVLKHRTSLLLQYVEQEDDPTLCGQIGSGR